jgi:hypothetical protein
VINVNFEKGISPFQGWNWMIFLDHTMGCTHDGLHPSLWYVALSGLGPIFRKSQA